MQLEKVSRVPVVAHRSASSTGQKNKAKKCNQPLQQWNQRAAVQAIARYNMVLVYGRPWLQYSTVPFEPSSSTPTHFNGIDLYHPSHDTAETVGYPWVRQNTAISDYSPTADMAPSWDPFMATLTMPVFRACHADRSHETPWQHYGRHPCHHHVALP